MELMDDAKYHRLYSGKDQIFNQARKAFNEVRLGQRQDRVHRPCAAGALPLSAGWDRGLRMVANRWNTFSR